MPKEKAAIPPYLKILHTEHKDQTASGKNSLITNLPSNLPKYRPSSVNWWVSNVISMTVWWRPRCWSTLSKRGWCPRCKIRTPAEWDNFTKCWPLKADLILQIHIYPFINITRSSLLFVFLLCHSCILLIVLSREGSLVSTTVSTLPMSCFLDAFHKNFVTKSTLISKILLFRTITAKHSNSLNFLVNSNRPHNMAIITTKTSSTTTIPIPPESQLHMLTRSLVRKLMIDSHLRYLQCWIVTF